MKGTLKGMHDAVGHLRLLLEAAGGGTVDGTGDAGDLIGDATETYAVIDLIEQELCAIDQDGVHIVNNTCRILQFFTTTIVKIKFLLTSERTYPCSRFITQ